MQDMRINPSPAESAAVLWLPVVRRWAAQAKIGCWCLLVCSTAIADESLRVEGVWYVVAESPLTLVCPNQSAAIYSWSSADVGVGIDDTGAKAAITATPGLHTVRCTAHTIDVSNAADPVSSVKYTLRFRVEETPRVDDSSSVGAAVPLTSAKPSLTGQTFSAPGAVPEGARGLIMVFVRDDCAPCKQWKRDVQPLLEKAGYEVQEIKTTGEAPRYVIWCNGRQTSRSGYMSVPVFNSIIQSLYKAKTNEL